MKPRAWSFSQLDSFTTCARKFCEESVTKTVPKREQDEAQIKGTWVHKMFEERIADGVVLVPELQIHEPMMLEIEAHGDTRFAERKVALNRKLMPCEYFAPDVWWRGVIDVQSMRRDGHHLIVDYKTGKKKPKPRQLAENALYAFATGALVVETSYYWTIDRSCTSVTYTRDQFGTILEEHAPDLSMFAEAFKLDIWPPKPNGLCKNYCDVVGCEYHGRGRSR